MPPFRASDDEARRHDFFDPGEVDPHAVGAVAAEQRRALHAMEFGIDDEDGSYSDGEDSNELQSLYGKSPRLEPREQIRRTLLSGGMVLVGCAAFVYVTVTIKGAQVVEPTPAPTFDGPPGANSPAGNVVRPGSGVAGDGKKGGSNGAGKDKGGSSVSVPVSSPSSVDNGGHFRVSEATNDEFVAWSQQLYEHTGLTDYKDGEPKVDWSLGIPKMREDRFPSVEERVRYCMGRFYDPSKSLVRKGKDRAGDDAKGVDLWGDDYLQDTYSLQRTTRTFTISSSFVVNLYDFDKRALVKCDEEENTVLHTYCRDYVDFAILHKEMSAGVIQHMGDSLPRTSPNKLKMGVGGPHGPYPVFNKVRHYCDIPAERTEKYPDYITKEDINSNCARKDKIETILWPLNRHRHFTPAAQISPYDIPWDEKVPKAIWRGGTNDALSDRKYALVSKHENSTIVNAKFAERGNKRGRHGDKTKGIPENWLSGFLDKEEQLRYRYLISIEGNDVSSGLKWMLFSNSVVLLPPTTFESWAMEGLLEPYVHYIPIKSDMSDVESQISWAESHPDSTKRIAQRSTLFIYDLLFHPQAMVDERATLRGIAERYEEMFGYTVDVREKHPLAYIHWGQHPERREDRFPNVEKRVNYAMGHWYDKSSGVDMSRREDKKTGKKGEKDKAGSIQKLLPPILPKQLDDVPKMNAPFVASGLVLAECPEDDHPGHDDPVLRNWCLESLPYFDERSIFDIVSTRHPLEDDPRGPFKLMEKNEEMTNSESKWFKRILIDDTVKVLHFGDGPPPEKGDNDGDDCKGGPCFPIFAGTRRAVDPKKGKRDPGGDSPTVLWRFGSGRGDDLVRSGLVEGTDVPFGEKRSRAVWRGGFGTEGVPVQGKGGSEEFENRLSMVKSTAPRSKLDARFILTDDALTKGQKKGGALDGVPDEMAIVRPRGREELADQLRDMLSYRYIVATEDEFRPNLDLEWMMLSRSVVLMPHKRRYSTWFMEDTLQPYVHFVPIADNYSDIEDQIEWCEMHRSEAERIAERATLFVHDFLFHKDAAKEDMDVMMRVMERYRERFGGQSIKDRFGV